MFLFLACLISASGLAAQSALEGGSTLSPQLSELLAASPEERAHWLDEHARELGSSAIQALIDDGDRRRGANELAAALADFELARDLADRLELPREAGRTRRSLARLLAAFGRYGEARTALQEARDLFERAGDAELAARTTLNLGIVARHTGDLEAALEAYAAGAAAARKLGNSELVAVALNNSAVVHLSRGDQRSALEALDRALELSAEFPGEQLAADIFANLGVLHMQQGNHELAVEYLQRSLNLQRELGNTFGSANEHANLGYARLALEQREPALAAFRESTRLADESGNHDLGARGHVGLARTLLEMGKLEAAAAEAGSALELARASSTPEALALALIFNSELDVRRGRPQSALASAREAGELVEGGHSRLRSLARQAQGRALEDLGHLEQAQDAYEGAIAAIEEQREAVAGGEIERQSFLEERVGPHERLLALLAGQGRVEPALAQAERAKARVLVEVLSGARGALARVLDPDERERERELREALAHDNADFDRAAQGTDASARSKAAASLQAARRAYESLRASLYANHPELRSRAGELPAFDLAQARASLDARTLVLEYAVTDERSYLFTLAREASAQLHVLPAGRRALEAATRRFRERLATRDLGLRSSARELCGTLLGPVRGLLPRYERLLVIPDGPLWELPFQVLECSPGHYLLERHALALAPSLTALLEMNRREPSRRARGGLLALGNPDVGDPARRRASALYRDATLDPLPEAEAEVRALGRLYGPKSAVFVGAEARESLVKAEAGKHAVIHLAAHGVLDDQSPLYSHIALARPAEGDADDGRLEAWELMDLSLNADLVVLSACESGLGHVGRGEGLIGLSWAFFVAGCPTTVVSQWKVDSDATSRLMLEFHKRLASGQPKAEALQGAALRLRRDARYRHPFYWAPFIVVGAGLGTTKPVPEAPLPAAVPVPRARP